MRLSENAISEQLTMLPKWKLKDVKWIERSYRFQDFLQAISFVNRVATYAENINHHPFINIQYKMVIIRLNSWNEKGLTELDFTMARQMDQIYDTNYR
ncbi:4a-hydroxytetrahydrobiopterin dehydratase [Alkalihalobacillus pseudalcaliphilus]|uniref:4a-hydroxytetrahydrobiopterin dehydratase n=1 Tax=Alkalihalobacillus pseudalcaliphilus TaxID=79884 RepID=UPI00064E08BD|nr:4a-hydroxytetrahydrobiopterin dehydratase [Alkalihalobacillus pseudalcaliphilus]KMK75127.1 pterin-4-alpha-carbinolamine dehydratase [Alkalihalobacillus pseudalcaliphilus]